MPRTAAHRTLTDARSVIASDVVVIGNTRGGQQYLATSMPRGSEQDWRGIENRLLDALATVRRYRNQSRKRHEKQQRQEVQPA